MTDNLQFDFIVDKNLNTITVRREFAADRQLVWDCHTKSELLDQWFAPKPLTTKTKSMDFSEGGHWHYAMVMPDGTEHWGYTKYSDINPIDSYRTVDAFANEAGEMNSDLPTATWHVSFTDFGDDDAHTMVETFVQYAALSDLETVLNMGMKEGLTSTLERLDELIEKLVA